MRAKVGWAVTFALTFIILGGGLAFERWREAQSLAGKVQWLDLNDANTCESLFGLVGSKQAWAHILVYPDVGPCFLYVFYGMYDAIFQSFCYWLMSALSNKPNTMYALPPTPPH